MQTHGISKYYASGYYDERAIGMNAGGTAAGGYCTVQVMRDPETSVTFLCVVMGGAWEDDSDTIYSYENAQSADNYGIELDIRQDLSFIGLANFPLSWPFNPFMCTSDTLSLRLT